jgi:PncC family amidohydrolase
MLRSARRLAKLLAESNHKVVFAESCTAGLVSQSLSRIPGISDWHCGGMVTYRNGTKAAYLGIDPTILKKPGPVSELVARLMAEGVLERTPEATVAASVTGHLGPNAPEKLDGVVYVAVTLRGGATQVRKLILPKDRDRAARQRLAAEAVLKEVAEYLLKLGN